MIPSVQLYMGTDPAMRHHLESEPQNLFTRNGVGEVGDCVIEEWSVLKFLLIQLARSVDDPSLQELITIGGDRREINGGQLIIYWSADVQRLARLFDGDSGRISEAEIAAIADFAEFERLEFKLPTWYDPNDDDDNRLTAADGILPLIDFIMDAVSGGRALSIAIPPNHQR